MPKRKPTDERSIGSFYIAINGESYDAIKDGHLRTANGIATYFILQRQAVFETGIWWGDASRIVSGSGRILSSDKAKRALREVCEMGHGKSFHVRGSRREYAIALHGYVVRYGNSKGMVLDAFATTDPRNPVYIKPTEALSRPIPGCVSSISANEDWISADVSGTDATEKTGVTGTNAPDKVSQAHVRSTSQALMLGNTPDVPEIPRADADSDVQIPHAQTVAKATVAESAKAAIQCFTPSAGLNRPDDDETIGEHFDYGGTEAKLLDSPYILELISDCEFDPARYPELCNPDFYAECNDEITDRLNEQYRGAWTHGDLMAKAMGRYQRDSHCSVESTSWYAIAKRLRHEDAASAAA